MYTSLGLADAHVTMNKQIVIVILKPHSRIMARIPNPLPELKVTLGSRIQGVSIPCCGLKHWSREGQHRQLSCRPVAGIRLTYPWQVPNLPAYPTVLTVMRHGFHKSSGANRAPSLDPGGGTQAGVCLGSLMSGPGRMLGHNSKTR